MFKIWTDGGSRGNPGPSGVGGVILSPENKILVEISEYIGIQTNNYAEYSALHLTLLKCLEFKINKVEVFMDSELIIRQMNGKYICKSNNLKSIYESIKEILSKFESITFKHIPRKLNRHADSLANKAMDLNLN